MNEIRLSCGCTLFTARCAEGKRLEQKYHQAHFAHLEAWLNGTDQETLAPLAQERDEACRIASAHAMDRYRQDAEIRKVQQLQLFERTI